MYGQHHPHMSRTHHTEKEPGKSRLGGSFSSYSVTAGNTPDDDENEVSPETTRGMVGLANKISLPCGVGAVLVLVLAVALSLLWSSLPHESQLTHGIKRLEGMPISISPHISFALRHARPVVALESTIISHGMPFPQNYETAIAIEQTIRDGGAIPATIAILNGTIRVGLSSSEIEYLAKHSERISKVSRRDLPVVIATKGDGATTVSATSFIASKIGVEVFVTGGIGGVHRKGEYSAFGANADLEELGRTKICVVSAGVKSILDIGRTLEYLETHGVTVATYLSDEFPAFFTPKSGIKSPHRFDSALDAALLIKASSDLQLGSGMLIAVPIPQEETDGEIVENAILEALHDAENSEISGNEITPFVLSQVAKKTKGASLRANIALILNNARVGAAIAVELASLRSFNRVHPSSVSPPKLPSIVVIGGSVVDVISRLSEKIDGRSSGRGRVVVRWGGVGRNIVEALARMGATDTLFITSVGSDIYGYDLVSDLRAIGLNTQGVRFGSENDPGTSVYNAILDENGFQIAGINDFDSCDLISPEWVERFRKELSAAQLVILDGNVPNESMEIIVTMCQKNSVPILFEPSTSKKAKKPFEMNLFTAEHPLTYVTPDIDELFSIALHLDSSLSLESSDAVDEALTLLIEKGFVEHVLGKLGPQGLAYAREIEGKVAITHYPAEPLDPSQIVTDTGAGDTLVGVFSWDLVKRKLSINEAISDSLRAAILTLQSDCSVSPLLSPDAVTCPS